MSSTSIGTEFTPGRRASKKVRRAIADGRIDSLFEIWQDHLSDVRSRIGKHLDSTGLLCLWSVDWSPLSDRERQLADGLEQLTLRQIQSLQADRGRNAARLLTAILTEWLETEGSAICGWETIAVAEVLVRLGHRLDSDVFLKCLQLVAAAVQNDGIIEDPLSLSGSGAPTDVRERVLVLTARGEAPWLCSLLLEPLGNALQLRKKAAEYIRALTLEATDSDGVPCAELLRSLPDLLTPLARIAFWSDVFKTELWNRAEQIRLENLTARVGLLCRPVQTIPDPDVPETAGHAFPSQPLRLLLSVQNPSYRPRLEKLLRKSEQVVTRVRKPGRHRMPGEQDASSSVFLRMACQSDESQVAVLRSSLRHDADLIVVHWQGSVVHLQMTAAGRTIFSGEWDWAARVDDQTVAAPLSWRCSCWFEDHECIFMELEGESASGMQCNRQIMLSTRQRFAILTDSVTTGSDTSRVQLTTALPVCAGSAILPDTITREILLNNGVVAARAFPLWLQDDRIQHATGQFSEHDGQFELNATGQGGTTAPLAIDWNPERRHAPADWSTLTVTEGGRYCGAFQASGHRIRVDRFQVMLYRSLVTSETARAVLGVHTTDESLYTRVRGVQREFSVLVQVEATASEP